MACSKKATPFILITLGLLFLLQNTNIVPNAFGTYWPIILIVWGLVKLYGATSK